MEAAIQAQLDKLEKTIRRACLATILGLLVTPARSESNAWSAPYEQAGIAVEVSHAVDGVVARDLAYREAIRRAWLRLKLALAQPLARASDREIEDMVASIIIEEERVLPNGYRGRLTVRFDPQRVEAIAGLLPPEPDLPAADNAALEPEQGMNKDVPGMGIAEGSGDMPHNVMQVPTAPILNLEQDAVGRRGPARTAPNPDYTPFRFRW